MYQFIQHKKLGLPFGQGFTDYEFKIHDVKAEFPVSVVNFLPEDSKLKLICKSGYQKYLLPDKFIQKKFLVSFEGHKTLWQVVDILYLQHSPYREITIAYYGFPTIIE